VIGKKITVVFADEEIQEAYFRMKTDNPFLYKFLERATDDLKENPFCGIQIPKRQIPKMRRWSHVQHRNINEIFRRYGF
jgi:hypothetical protein